MQQANERGLGDSVVDLRLLWFLAVKTRVRGVWHSF
jgi:hypothetical protein